MEKRAASALILALLLLNTLALTSDIQLTSANVNDTANSAIDMPRKASDEKNPPSSSRLDQRTWDLPEANWSSFAKVDNGRIEVVVGVDNKDESSFEELRQLIAENQAVCIDTVSMQGEILAVVVDIPVTSASTFKEKVRSLGLSRYIEPNLRFQAFFVPNDPYWPQQWGPAKIGADYAWNTTRGDPSVLVAVVDTGIDWKHPDLAANYVALGYDWVNKDADPMDDNGHGTHCAGIIAATLNNKLGIAGLAQVRIMAEKGLDSWGSGNEDDLANAIIDAVDKGADIISCSWGSYIPSALIHEAIKYAYEREVLVVAAVGNGKTNRRSYPAAHDEVVAVSATDQNDNPASFTNFGDWIELAAPGVNIYSTYYNNSYANFSGTSMSCPHVAAVAALVWSVFPNAVRDWVRLRLAYTADDLGDIGLDDYYGYGRINARRAVQEIPPNHDLVISSWQSPAYVDPGTEDLVSTTVVNLGAENEADITVQLLVNGSVVSATTIHSLATFKSVTLNCSWTPTIEGVYNVTSYVVPVQNEISVENNAMRRYVFVGIKTIEVPVFCPTIQEAIDTAGSGFTILVRAGTYFENVVIYNKTVSLIGENRDTTIIDGGQTGNTVTVVADNVSIVNFTLQNSGTYWYDSGIMVYGSNDVVIRNNTMTLNNYGVYFGFCFNCTLIDNNAVGNAHFGFLIELSLNCTFSENFVAYNFDGIILDSCPNAVVRESNVTDNVEDILLLSCPNSTLYGNNVANSEAGLYLHYSPNSTLRNNNMTGKGWRDIWNLDVWGSELSDFILDIDISNTVNGKPVYYWINKRDQAVPLDAGYVGLINCTNITVKGLSLKHNGEGMLLAYTNSSLITDNTIVNNEYAIQLLHSQDNLLFRNNLVENMAGISLDFSSYNSLLENNVTNVFRRWGILINAQSSHNSVFRNNITDTFEDGIMIYYESRNNSISGNNITRSDLHAICVRYSSDGNLIYANNALDNFNPFRLDESSSNIIFHNNFIGYTREPEVYAQQNAWDNGYPSGGNYWSHYTGVDFYSGPYQNEPGSDGIGDTPYILDTNNRDRYPLMNPYIASHDVALNNITPAKTVVGKGYNLYISVKVTNEGDCAEALDITVHANTTQIAHRTIGLESGATTTLTFTWNTAVFDKAYWTLSACMSAVLGETDTADNTCTDGTVRVATPGDVNTDGTVDILDVACLSAHWYPGPPIGPLGFDPNFDIDNDGEVNIIDIAIVSAYWTGPPKGPLAP